MAQIVATNQTTSAIYFPSLQVEIAPGSSHTFDRFLPEAEAMRPFMEALRDGNITIAVTIEDWEVTWREFLTSQAAGYALAGATRTIHKPTVTPGDAAPQPGLGPSAVVMGTVIGLEYTGVSDAAYRILKVDTTFAGDGSGADASFHIHWTKGGDLNEQGNTVRWKLSYTVFNGSSEDVALASPTVLSLDDTYSDSGTTTRVIHRTANVPAPGLTLGYYIGVKIEVDPAGTTLSGNPVLVSADMLFTNTINLGS